MKEYKYLMVYDSIVDDIQNGYLKYNDKIPSIRKMAKKDRKSTRLNSSH